MRRYLFGFAGFYAVLLFLNSCIAAKPVAHSYSSHNTVSKNKPAQHKPKYLDNIALGSKGGNKINMDVGNKKRQQENTDEETTDNREVLNKQSAAQQSVDIVDETETATPLVKKAVVAEKPLARNKRHKKGRKKRNTSPSVDLDTEPLVDVVPTNGPNDIPKTRANIQPKDIAGNKPIDNVSCQLKYAGILCSIPQALTNIALYKFIDDWYGVDYRMGGNDKNGIDCSAFAQRLYQEVFGLSLVRTALEQFNYVTIIRDIDKLKEGDLVFFHVHSKHITHVGVYLMNRFFVHASSSQGVVISSLNDAYWSKYRCPCASFVYV